MVIQQKKSGVVNIFIVILLLILIISIPFIVGMIHSKKYKTYTKENPFSSVPQIRLSGSPISQITSPSYIQKSLNIPSFSMDQPMIPGEYRVYPLNRPRNKTSIVAVEAGPSYDNFNSWMLEISTFSWNFVFPSPSSAYWICPVVLSATPVVVLKGQFPLCRYFSVVAYGGIDFTDGGESLFGVGVKRDGTGICNPEVDTCSQLHDTEIVPDEGSKNPFTDTTYKDGDDKFYTIYLVSPYYKGSIPDWPNVISLGSYGMETAVILLRIYSPFNPKSCDSNIFNSTLPFNRLGCDTDKKLVIPPTDGGAVYDSKDKTSKCKTGDAVCVQKCVNFELGKNNEPDCLQYVGYNKYCVCERLDGPCAKYVDETIKKCSNNTADINSFCLKKPKQSVSYCIDKIPVKPSFDKINPKTACSSKECNYVKEGKIQQCIASKLIPSKNPACEKYKDSTELSKICNEDYRDHSTCAYEFNKYLNECLDTKSEQALFPLYCKIQSKKMTQAYDPEYDFETEPLCCKPDAPRYTCANGYCIPSVNGEFTTPDCNKQCKVQCTPSPQTLIPTLLPTHAPTDAPTSKPSVCVNEIKENYEGCETRNDPAMCNPFQQKYLDINIFSGINSADTITYAWGGWTDLPDVFVKYNYNNYFVKLNRPQFPINSELNAIKLTKTVLKAYKEKRNQNPNNKLNIEENAIEGFRLPSKKEYCYPISTPAPTHAPTHAPAPPTHAPVPPTPTPDSNKCNDYVDPKKYLYIGAEFPSGLGKTRVIPAAGCNYYADLNDCKNGGKRNSGSSNDKQYGIVDCNGDLCFKRWAVKKNTVEFHGIAIPASTTPNTTNFVVFPNPDSTYVGFPTVYNNDCVYTIWFDSPVSPETPGFNNLWDTDSYQLRYWDISHNFYEQTLLNARPTLSGLNDHQVRKVPISYTDESTGKKLHSKRVGFVLCSYQQYNYLKTYNLWNENMNWLNWGKTKLPSIAEVNTIINDLSKLAKKIISFLPEVAIVLDQVIEFLQNIFKDMSDLTSGFTSIIEFLEKALRDIQSLVDRLLPEVGILVVEIVTDIKDILNVLIENLTGGRVPKYGVVFLRHLLPTSKFNSSINGYISKKPDCLNKNIILPSSVPFQEPNVIHPYCNPGNPDYCQEYGLDPCCIPKDLLKHMKQYYPRVEKVKMCDIENMGASFFDKYLYYPLPYQWDADTIPSSECCLENKCKEKKCNLSDDCLKAIQKANSDSSSFIDFLPSGYDWLKQILADDGSFQQILLCKVSPEQTNKILNSKIKKLQDAYDSIIKVGKGQVIADRVYVIITELKYAQKICGFTN